MKITDMNLLVGQSSKISLSELRKNPGDIFTQVQMGKEFTVTKNGKAIAVISRPEMNALQLGAAARGVMRRFANDTLPPVRREGKTPLDASMIKRQEANVF